MREPAVIFASATEFIKAIIPLLIIFGIIHWTGEQVAQVMLVVSVGFAFVNTVLTRSQVTSQPQVDALISTAIKMPTGTSIEAVKVEQAEKDAKS